MANRVLLQIEDKLIKAITIKCLIEPGYEIIEISGHDDLLFKLNIYPDDFRLFIIEINNNLLPSIFERVWGIKEKGFLKNTAVLGLIQKDTHNIKKSALKSGFNDLMLIPSNQKDFKKQLCFKLDSLIKGSNLQISLIDYMNSEKLNIKKIKEMINNEISLAKRGKYPFSILLIRFSNLKVELIWKACDKLSTILRKTDRVYQFNDYEWIITCPYTEKKHIVNVEHKIYEVLREKLSIDSTVKYVSLGMATYPQDSESFDGIFEILEAGVKADMAINRLKGTLKNIPRNELDNYQRIMNQYKYLNANRKKDP